MSSPTAPIATVSMGAVVVVSTNVVDVVVVDGTTTVEVVVVSPVVETHADAMIAIEARPTVAARWMGKVVTGGHGKSVLGYSLGLLAALVCSRQQPPLTVDSIHLLSCHPVIRDT